MRKISLFGLLILFLTSPTWAQIGPPPGGSSSITPGTTPAACGTAGSLFYSDGTYIQCAGATKAASLALGGATIGSNALAEVGGVSLSDVSLVQMANMASPTVTPVGTTGSTSWSYTVVAVDAAGNTTAAPAATNISNGNATLNTSNYNTISWTIVSPGNVASYNIYRTVAGGTPSTTGFIASVTYLNSSYSDKGAAGNAAAAPTTNTTGMLYIGSSSFPTGALGTTPVTISGQYYPQLELIDAEVGHNALAFMTSYGAASMQSIEHGVANTPLSLNPGGGNVAIGTSGATENINGLVNMPNIVSDATFTDNTLCWNSSVGRVYYGSGTLGICLGTSSDRYKHGVVPLGVGLSQIMGLRPVSYYLNTDHGDPNHLLYGFLAEDGSKILPDLVGLDVTGHPNTFDYLGVVPVLVKAMQEQQKEIDALIGNGK